MGQSAPERSRIVSACAMLTLWQPTPLSLNILIAGWLKESDNDECQQQEKERTADFKMLPYRQKLLRLLTYVVETDFLSMQTEMHNPNKVTSQISTVFIENIPDV